MTLSGVAGASTPLTSFPSNFYHAPSGTSTYSRLGVGGARPSLVALVVCAGPRFHYSYSRPHHINAVSGSLCTSLYKNLHFVTNLDLYLL